MRLLVTIPHYFRRDATGHTFYGSERGDVEKRLIAVEACLAALHQTFGPRQALLGPLPTPSNQATHMQIDVVLITAGDQHLANLLPAHLFNHFSTSVSPRTLGFVCHEFLREHIGRYDWYAFLEDDIEITDPLYFHKLGWFASKFGDDTILQPNRFEICHALNVQKLYVDGQMTTPELAARFQDITTRPRLVAEVFGHETVFKRVPNVHSGCFALNAAQLDRIVRDPEFAVPNDMFFGPLESAVTLPIMRNFAAYKPARRNAAFLEVRHTSRRFLMQDTAPAAPAASAPAAS